MLLTALLRLLWMTALVAAQLFVFNHVHLFGYATPLPFIYFLLLFRLGTQRWSILLWGFVCGVLTDIVSLTPGVGAASMTLTAFIQPPLLSLLVPEDAIENLRPGYDTLGFWGYVRYAVVLTFVFCLAYFLILSFSFQRPLDLAISCGASWGLTLLLCLIFEGFHRTHE